MTGLGINVKIKESGTQKAVPTAQVSLEKDLKSCMRCRFFYGNDSQCIAKGCIKESKQFIQPEMDIGNMCYKCPYKQNEGYCFPCMKKIMRKSQNMILEKYDLEKEGKNREGL